MAKIVINKNFQSKYLYRAYERLVKPDYPSYTDNMVSHWVGDAVWKARYRIMPYYNDLSSAFTSTWAGVSPSVKNGNGDDSTITESHYNRCNYFVCDETFLTFLNKLNTKIKNEGLNSLQKTPTVFNSVTNQTDVNKTANININILMASLFNMNKTIRDNTIKYFELSNIISTSESNLIKSLLSPLKRINNNVSMDGYGVSYIASSNQLVSNLNNTTLEFVSNEVLKLEVPYKSSNNLINSNLYVLILPVVDTKLSKPANNNMFFSYIGLNKTVYDGNVNDIVDGASSKMMLPYTSFHDKVTNTAVNQIPYIALSLTETGMGGDIEYDHLDEIEYLDEIKISMTLPKEYV